jgi:hypothetical protein
MYLLFNDRPETCWIGLPKTALSPRLGCAGDHPPPNTRLPPTHPPNTLKTPDPPPSAAQVITPPPTKKPPTQVSGGGRVLGGNGVGL